jgi:hypothetical protein
MSRRTAAERVWHLGRSVIMAGVRVLCRRGAPSARRVQRRRRRLPGIHSLRLQLDAWRDKCCGAPSAVRHLLPGACMNNVVERILTSYGKDVGGSREKLRNYLGLLASSGKTDEQLFSLGSAYLKELLEPDPRYSGC